MADLIGERLGQYTIEAVLGEGGMATVYRARQESMDRDVAVKVIRSKLAHMSEFIKRFEREARTVASLSHAHILKVFDYGQHDDLIYLVMEMLSGGSLADLINKGPMPLSEVSRLLDQIASALDHAHRRGVIHRDLKPQNVLLNDEVDAFLTDFGIAKIMHETGTVLTQSSAAVGTPAYMSPEQWKGAAIDSRADIYALGVMVYEMLTGRLPFHSDTPYGMMHSHIYEAMPSILKLRPDLAPAVDKVLIKALAKTPEERFQSAAEFSSAFKIAMAGGDPLPDADYDAPTGAFPIAPRAAVAAVPSSSAVAAQPIPNPSVTMPSIASAPNIPPAHETISAQNSVKNRRPLRLGMIAGGLVALCGISIILALFIINQYPALFTGVPSPTLTSMPTSPLTATSLVVAITSTPTNIPTSTSTTTPTEGNLVAVISGPQADQTTQTLIFNIQSTNIENIGSYRVEIIDQTTHIIVKQYHIKVPPYDSIEVPYTDLPGGKYYAELQALDLNDNPTGAPSQVDFEFTPPQPTATLTWTPTQIPTSTPTSIQPTHIPTFTPTSVSTLAPLPSEIPIGTPVPTIVPVTPNAANTLPPCPDTLPTRLVINGRGRVTIGGAPNRLRDAANGTKVLNVIPPGEVFAVLDGPICTGNQIAWWQVSYNGQVGWTAESSGADYYLEPLDSPLTFNTNLNGWTATNGTDGTVGKWSQAANGKVGAYFAGDDFDLSSDSDTDFTYEGDIVLQTPNANSAAGLAFRVTSPLTSGYVVNINLENGGSVKLLKFPAFKLSSYNTPIHAGVSYHLKVVVAGINIKVYFNNNAAPVIDVNDTTYTSGYFGLNVYQATGIFQNIYRHTNP